MMLAEGKGRDSRVNSSDRKISEGHKFRCLPQPSHSLSQLNCRVPSRDLGLFVLKCSRLANSQAICFKAPSAESLGTEKHKVSSLNHMF